MPSAVGGADRGVGMGGGCPLPLGGMGGLPQEILKFLFILVHSQLVKSRGSFMQKETTIKEKKLYMHRHFVIYHPLILGLYIILFYF